LAEPLKLHLSHLVYNLTVFLRQNKNKERPEIYSDQIENYFPYSQYSQSPCYRISQAPVIYTLFENASFGIPDILRHGSYSIKISISTKMQIRSGKNRGFSRGVAHCLWAAASTRSEQIVSAVVDFLATEYRAQSPEGEGAR